MVKSLSLSVRTHVVAVSAAVMSELAGEAVILDPESGTYYGLSNDVGIRIWQLIQQPIEISRICDLLLSEYDVEPERCKGDVITLLQVLIGHHLVEICDESAA